MKVLTKSTWLIVLSSIFITLLFFNKLLGINVLIVEFSYIGLAHFLFKPRLTSLLSKGLFIGTVLTAILVVFHNSGIAKLVNLVSFLLLIGSINFYENKMIQSYIHQLFHSLYEGGHSFLDGIFKSKTGKIRFLSILKIIGIPLLLILFFFIIYYNSNEYFAKLSDSVLNKIGDFLSWLPSINFAMVVTFVISLLFSIVFFYRIRNNSNTEREAEQSDQLKRRRIPMKNRNFLALKSEYKSAIFLLICLNLMLVVFNFSDITTVWFSYKWDGGFLKEFVHSGTYLLLISLVVSILIVLYYFRGNLNFYKKNTLLKTLTYIWLSQNLLLVISLFIRNTIYINHFALAYKRIGVYAFLIATIILIATILIKIKQLKSFSYVVKKNTFSIYFIFVTLSFVNWDVFIAKYNTNSYENSFVEMDFLSQLSNKALPYVDLNNEKLNEIDNYQNEKFSFKTRGNYISPKSYKQGIENRIRKFMNEYPERSWLEWNYADYRAYKKLSEK